MYWYRLVDAHFAILPKTARLLGAKRFTQEVCACIAAQPSRTPVLERLAVPFARFIQGRESAGISRVEREMATLDACGMTSLLAVDPESPPFTREDTQSATLAETVVQRAPSVQACVVSSAALDLYETLSRIEGDVPDGPFAWSTPERTEDTGVVFVRPGFAVHHHAVAADEVAWLSSDSLTTVGELLTDLAGPSSDARLAFERFAIYVDHHFLVRLETA